MDQKEFVPIGIIDIYWVYEPFDAEIRKGYFEFYIPKKIGNMYGEQYCNRFVFLDDCIATKVETVETMNFDFKQLEYDERTKLFRIKFLDNILYLNKEQYKLLQEKLSNLNINFSNTK